LARLRLRTWTLTEQLVYRATGEVISHPAYRLMVRMEFVHPDKVFSWRPRKDSRQARRFDAVVDTGASLSNIPYEIWEPFASEIRWIKTANQENIIRVGGMSIRYRLGRVMLAVIDNDLHWMPPAWTVARFWDYYEDVPPPLLGLSSPFLMNGRTIRHAISSRSGSAAVPVWWLEDSR
jgi:hypothetical protein